MKQIQWQNKLGLASHILINSDEYRPGRTGRGTYGNVDVLLQITGIENDTTLQAIVIGFDPLTTKLSDLQFNDKVLIGIKEFLPDR